MNYIDFVMIWKTWHYWDEDVAAAVDDDLRWAYSVENWTESSWLAMNVGGGGSDDDWTRLRLPALSTHSY